jgi:transcriptional regulator with XRE-family HTH domain
MISMMNRANFLALVSPESTQTLEKNRWRIANRVWLRASQDIALKILDQLELLNWSQKDLAEKMGVSPQYINKIVKGKENLTLETLSHLQIVLEIPLLASYYEAHNQKVEAYILQQTMIVPMVFSANYSQKQSKVMQIHLNLPFAAYSSQQKEAYGT